MKLTLHLQEGAYYPYGQEDVDFTKGLSENGLYYVNIRSVSKKEARSNEQNKMQFKWFRDLEQQGDQTANDYRAYSKLHFGVPCLRMEDEEFRAVYDSIIKPIPYEDKLKLMVEPIDLPVTSRMTVETMSKYLKSLSDHFLDEGFQLTKFEHLQEWLEEDLQHRK